MKMEMEEMSITPTMAKEILEAQPGYDPDNRHARLDELIQGGQLSKDKRNAMLRAANNNGKVDKAGRAAIRAFIGSQEAELADLAEAHKIVLVALAARDKEIEELTAGLDKTIANAQKMMKMIDEQEELIRKMCLASNPTIGGVN